jgi:hypothetical protein
MDILGYCGYYVSDDEFCGLPVVDEYHEGACVMHIRRQWALEAEGERQAEQAAERYYEGGWDVLGVYDHGDSRDPWYP